MTVQPAPVPVPSTEGRPRQRPAPSRVNVPRHARPGASPLARLRSNHLLTSSLFLILNSGLQAAAGFIFWILSAHLFSVADVGLATSLLAVAGAVGFLSLLGLNSTVVRFLPGAEDPNTLITSSLALVAAATVVFGAGYLVIVPYVAPKLAFVDHNPLIAIGFIAMAALGTLNLLTDAIFIGLRQARFNVLVDGVIGGVTKIVAGIAVAGAGAFGLYIAATIGYTTAAVASVILLLTVLRYRPKLKGSAATLVPLVRFSGANYLGNLFTLLPTFVLPLIVLDRIGARATAFYYIAFQVANLLYAGVYAVEQSFLAEGSQTDADLRHMMRRSSRLLALFCVPSSLLIAAASPWLLLLFGKTYSSSGAVVLAIFALSALPLAALNWLLTVLRLTGKLGTIMTANFTFAVVTCVVAWALAPHGLAMMAVAWPVGLASATLIASITVLRSSRKGTLRLAGFSEPSMAAA